jgi:hypothetical protein
VTLRLPQIPYRLSWDWTCASAVRNRRLSHVTAWPVSLLVRCISPAGSFLADTRIAQWVQSFLFLQISLWERWGFHGLQMDTSFTACRCICIMFTYVSWINKGWASSDFCTTTISDILFLYICLWPPPWSSNQSFWLRIQRPRVRFPALPDFLRSIGSGTGST